MRLSLICAERSESLKRLLGDGWTVLLRRLSGRRETSRERLRVPFGYLFFAEPPSEELPIPDFRRGSGGAGSAEPSVDLRDVIADTLRKQDWYRDFRLDGGEGPVEVVGLFTTDSEISDVAASIAAALDFDAKVRCAAQADGFLRAFVDQVERHGILVMRNGVVRQNTSRALDVREFRGFSLADPTAPVIFINNADSVSAEIFTLAHELAHIWIAQSGISDADPTTMDRDVMDVESFCNAVAAELLLPWSRIADRWYQNNMAISVWVADVSREFRVSTVMVAKQLWSHEAISREDFGDYVVWCLVKVYVGGWGVVCGVVGMRGGVVVFVVGFVSVVVFLCVRGWGCGFGLGCCFGGWVGCWGWWGWCGCGLPGFGWVGGWWC